MRILKTVGDKFLDSVALYLSLLLLLLKLFHGGVHVSLPSPVPRTFSIIYMTDRQSRDEAILLFCRQRRSFGALSGSALANRMVFLDRLTNCLLDSL